jgi:hypothetical protein
MDSPYRLFSALLRTWPSISTARSCHCYRWFPLSLRPRPLTYTQARSVSVQRPLFRSLSAPWSRDSPHPPPLPAAFPVHACPRAISPSIISAAATSISYTRARHDNGDAKLHLQPMHLQAPNVLCVPAPDDGDGTCDAHAGMRPCAHSMTTRTGIIGCSDLTPHFILPHAFYLIV